jgi:ABC-type sulfate transport system permease component
MKRTIIGGVLALIGTLGNLAVIILTSNNLVSGWSTPPGRFLSTVSELGMTPVISISCIALALGLLIMGIEYFKIDKK